MTDRDDGRSHPGAPEADASGAPVWDGVLFDLDDTLLDLKTAQRAAFTAIVRRQWPEVHERGEQELEAAAAAFAPDAHGHYQRYLAGELTFAEQRLARAADALAVLGAPTRAATPEEGLWLTGEEIARRALSSGDPRDTACVSGLRLEAGQEPAQTGSQRHKGRCLREHLSPR